MSYLATGDGEIGFKGPLKKEEFEQALETIHKVFEIDMQIPYSESMESGRVCVHIHNNYHEDNVVEVLDQLAENFTIVFGEIEYVGEDKTHWRFIFKDGKWHEQQGRLVYDDDDEFGEVTWCRDDVASALRDMGVTPYPELLDSIVILCKENHHFTDPIVEAGWGVLNSVIRDYIKDNPNVMMQLNEEKEA